MTPRDSISKYYSIAFLTACLFLAPLLFDFSLVEVWNWPRILAISGLLALLSGIGLVKKGFKLKVDSVFLVIAIGWVVVMVITSIQVKDMPAAIYLIGMRCLLIGLAIAMGALKEARSIPIILSLFAIFEGIVGLGQGLGLIEFRMEAEGIVGTVGNPNGYASLMVLLFPFAVINSLSNDHKIRIIGFAAIVACLVGIVATFSIAAIIAFAIGLILPLLGWRFGEILRQNRKATHLLSTIFFLVVTFAGLVWGLANFDQTERIDSEISGKTERAFLWRETAAMVIDRPLGNGIGSWKYEILNRGVLPPSTSFGQRYYAEAHNDFIQMAAESGILGALAYLGILLLIFNIALQKGLRTNSNHSLIIGFLLASAILSWSIISAYHFPIERMDHLIVLAAIFASVLALEPIGNALNAVLSKVLALLMMLVSIAIFYFAFESLTAEHHLRNARNAQMEGSWVKMLQECKLVKPNICQADYFSSTPVSWYQGLAEYQSHQLPKALESFRLANAQNPAHPHILNNLAATFVGLQQFDSAIVYYEISESIFPEFEEPYLNHAKIKAALGDTVAAIQILKKYPDLPSNGRKNITRALRDYE